MKVLVIGGGGREHALAWALTRSAPMTEVVCAPGNAGIADDTRCVPVDGTNLSALVRVAQAEAPGLTVVGPEVPLALGLVDELQARGLRVFGPTRAAARLESSKAFAKNFMRRHGIPTAAYAVCSTIDELHAALSRFALPVVVKADGLAAGKGVVICQTQEQAERAAEEMFSGLLLGAAETRVVLEEFLAGEEVSFFAVCDGRQAVALAAAKDHKRIGEGDTGPNTGGMGAYSTDALLTPEVRAWLTEHVAQRVVDGMAAEGTPFAGVLFCGMMMVPDSAGALRPMVLEFNTRFGDPETEAIVMRLETDLLELLDAAVEGDVGRVAVRMRPGASVCVVAASGGYPGRYASGKSILGLNNHKFPPGVKVFHSGTAHAANGTLITAGGRVLGVTAVSELGLNEALALAYAAMAEIWFEGMQYRRDIGRRAL